MSRKGDKIFPLAAQLALAAFPLYFMEHLIFSERGGGHCCTREATGNKKVREMKWVADSQAPVGQKSLPDRRPLDR